MAKLIDTIVYTGILKDKIMAVSRSGSISWHCRTWFWMMLVLFMGLT